MSATPPPAAAPGARWRVRFPSLGARLVGLFLVLALAVAATFLLGMNQRQRLGWREYMQPLVMNYADLLVAEIGSPPDVARARLLTQHLPLHIRIEGPQVNWDSADEPPPPPPPLPPPGARPPLRHEVVTLPNGDPIPLILPGPPRPPRAASDGERAHDHAHDRDRDHEREHDRASSRAAGRPPGPPRLEDSPSDWHIVRRLQDGHRVIFSLADMSREQRAEHIGWATLAALLLLTGFAYALVRRMLHPLVALREGAVRYGQGDFSRPIVPRHADELGDLAEQVNGMAARLHHMLDAKRQLLLAISHELRSPLARARINAELVDESAERSALLRDLGEMRDLITDLLESERLANVQAGGHAVLHTEVATLASVVHAQCDAQAGAGELALSLDESLPAIALDLTRIRLLLRNLVDNAARHGIDAAQAAVVSTHADGAWQVLVVRDFGAGMAPEQLQHATDAFYRADAARQRSTGGVGLGLYLCRLVAEAHGGSLALRNADPGLEITVRLPASSGSTLA